LAPSIFPDFSLPSKGDMLPNRRAVRIFNNRIDAEHALHELNRFGFLVEQISMVALDIDLDNQLGGASMSDHVGNKALVYRAANSATITGSMLGAIGGCLLGVGLLAVPGVGLVVAVGTSGALIATLGSAGIGIGLAIGGLIEAKACLGMTDSPARVDSDRLKRGEYLVIVNGTDDEVRRAKYILSRL
jgi:hypothetical protein